MLPAKTRQLIDGMRMSEDSRVQVILVIAGEKPAADFIFCIDDVHGKKRKIYYTKADIKKVLCTLRHIGLSAVQGKTFRFVTRKNKKQLISRYVMICVSRDMSKARELVKLSPRSGSKDGYRFGMLNGYPKTAVDAYMGVDIKGLAVHRNQKVLIPLEEERRRHFSKRNWYRFKSFRLSRRHWREEIKTAKRWMYTVKKLHPALYRKRTERPS